MGPQDGAHESLTVVDGNGYWRAAEPKRSYDVVVVGGGGHGLATAYYLARKHGITDVAILEKGWLGGGNMARNTTIIRSNYLWDESAAIYEHSLKLWEGLEEELDFDVGFSQRGVLNLAHDLGEVRSSLRRVNSNRLNGVDAEWLTPDEVVAFCPIISVSPDVRYPVLGATLQRRGGVARHDRQQEMFSNREWRAMTALHGRTHAVPIASAWTSSNTVRSRVLISMPGAFRVSAPPAERSARAGSRSRQPGIPRSSVRCWGSGCRCKAIRCRHWCRSFSNPSSSAS